MQTLAANRLQVVQSAIKFSLRNRMQFIREKMKQQLEETKANMPATDIRPSILNEIEDLDQIATREMKKANQKSTKLSNAERKVKKL